MTAHNWVKQGLCFLALVLEMCYCLACACWLSPFCQGLNNSNQPGQDVTLPLLLNLSGLTC